MPKQYSGGPQNLMSISPDGEKSCVIPSSILTVTNPPIYRFFSILPFILRFGIILVIIGSGILLVTARPVYQDQGQVQVQVHHSRFFPWSNDLIEVRTPRTNHTFVYASASWPWWQHVLSCDTFFLYYEKELYTDLVPLVSLLKDRGKSVYIVLDPEPPQDGTNGTATFLDLDLDPGLRQEFIEELFIIIQNLTLLGVNGFVIGDEWPRGLNGHIDLDDLVRHNTTYKEETGSWMRFNPSVEEKYSLAEWFYDHAFSAWDQITHGLRNTFPDLLIGTNLDLVWDTDLSIDNVAHWKKSLSWDEIDLTPYDFVVTHYFTKMQISNQDPELEMNYQSIKKLTEKLDKQIQTGLDKPIYLLLAAHCTYPYVITPMQMVQEWNALSPIELDGIGWFTFDLWLMKGEEDEWIDSIPITDNSVRTPMKYERLLTLKDLLDVHTYKTSLMQIDESKARDIKIMEEKSQAMQIEVESRDNNDMVVLDLTNMSGIPIEAWMVTFDENLQTHPSVSGNIVVWEDARNGNRDIHTYDLGNEIETRLVLPGDQRKPIIKGSYIVYWDYLYIPTPIEVHDLANQIWELTNTSSAPSGYHWDNYTYMHIKPSGGQHIIYIKPRPALNTTLFLDIETPGTWELYHKPSHENDAIVQVQIKEDLNVIVEFIPNPGNATWRPLPFQVYYDSLYDWFNRYSWLNWPYDHGEINTTVSLYGSKSLGLCVYDTLNNSINVLDIRGSITGLEVDDEYGWIGTQDGRDTLVFFSTKSEEQVWVIRWGATTTLEAIIEGWAYWSESIPGTNRICALDLSSPSKGIQYRNTPPSPIQEYTATEIYGDIAITPIHQQTITMSLLTLFLLIKLVQKTKYTDKGPRNRR